MQQVLFFYYLSSENPIDPNQLNKIKHLIMDCDEREDEETKDKLYKKRRGK